jgi:predicted enzyme related to lactoylglutathione lyase
MAVVSHGRFVWHELMTADPTAVGFYEQVIGWTVMSWDKDPSYRMLAWKGVPMAGVMPLSDEARRAGVPPHWIAYVTVPDIDVTVAKAVGLGARNHFPPMTVPSVGRVAVLSDPQGATIGAFQPETPGTASDDFVLGDFSWHELVADDWKAAWEFYRALFSWEFDSKMDMGAMGTYWMFRRGGGARALGGMYNRPPEVPAAHWLSYVHVPSADRAATIAPQHGGSVMHGPVGVPGGGRIAILTDGQGAPIAVHASKPKAAAKQPAKKAPARKAKPAKPARRPVKKAAPRRRR